MDIASLLGIVLGLAMLIYGIIDNAGVSGFVNYLDVPSAIITFGGAFAATLASYTLQDFLAGLQSLLLIFKAHAMISFSKSCCTCISFISSPYS